MSKNIDRIVKTVSIIFVTPIVYFLLWITNSELWKIDLMAIGGIIALIAGGIGAFYFGRRFPFEPRPRRVNVTRWMMAGFGLILGGLGCAFGFYLMVSITGLRSWMVSSVGVTFLIGTSCLITAVMFRGMIFRPSWRRGLNDVT